MGKQSREAAERFISIQTSSQGHDGYCHHTSAYSFAVDVVFCFEHSFSQTYGAGSAPCSPLSLKLTAASLQVTAAASALRNALQANNQADIAAQLQAVAAAQAEVSVAFSSAGVALVWLRAHVAVGRALGHL